MKKLIFLAVLTLNFELETLNSFSQNVGINASGTAPDNSAILDVSSTTKGLLIPRMTTTERNAIPSPTTSLLIFNTTTNCLEMYVNGGWYTVSCPSACSAPATPTATAATSITTSGFTANWGSITGATTYYLDVSLNSGFSTFVSGYNNLNVGNVLSSAVTTLTCNTAYYYRVRSGTACTSASSNIITTTTSACFTCGSPFTDARDGKSYNTVLIGSQCWMAQNLNYGTYAAVTTPQVSGTKFCQNYSGVNDALCPIGGLYSWTNMMNGAASCNGTGAPPNDKCATNVQGLCPAGWHIPSHYEWTTLEKNAGSLPGSFPYNTTTTGWLGSGDGGNLKESGTTNWTSPNIGGTNNTGFTALPGGYSSGGSFSLVKLYAWFWTGTEYDATSSWLRALVNNDDKSYRDYFNPKTTSYSVRCLQD